MKLQKVTPFLWFNHEAADAAIFYTSVFKNSQIISTGPMVTVFELEGMQVMALNGGPHYKLTEAFSFYISCDTQEEIDYYWEKLLEGGGQESRCGWLKDRFGLSWQVIPSSLPELMNAPEKAQRIVQAFQHIIKFNIQELENL